MTHVLAEVEKNTSIVMVKTKQQSIASYIDHTLLKPDSTQDQVKQICYEAKQQKFAAVCIPPYYVQKACELLENSQVKIATVIGFPLGYNMTSAKAEEARKAISDGADELDMVMNIAAFKSGKKALVKDDIQSITTLARLRNKVTKVIIETALLDEHEIRDACSICEECESNFVKTCTGFNGGGARVEDIQTMRETLSSRIKIKASGGIKDIEFANQLIEAGADRLGTSSGLKLVGNA